jgi:hypothetical protein
MKRYLIAMGLLTAFSAVSLSALSAGDVLARGAGAGNRVTINDREDNNQQNPQEIGTLRVNATYTVQGSLGTPQSGINLDLVDNYSFRVEKADRYVLSLGGEVKAGSAELRLYTRQTLIANKKPGQPIDMVLQPGIYRMEVFRTPFAKGSFTYTTSIISPQS